MLNKVNALQNKTALVTGASSGIGKEIARKFGAQGCNLILVARSEKSLNELAEELTSKYRIICNVICADLTLTDSVPQIVAQINRFNLHVDILINNAGLGTYGPFETIAPQLERDQIAVNISAVVGLTHAFIPGMLKKGAGSILNIASTASFQPCPYLAVYAATKAFVLSFSEALWAEYKGRGILVTALCPPAVDTSFIKKLGDDSVTKTSVFSKMITPEVVAKEALKALNRSNPSQIIGIKNWLMANSIRLAPRSVVAALGVNMLRPPSQK
jgi:uncharacterized protein